MTALSNAIRNFNENSQHTADAAVAFTQWYAFGLNNLNDGKRHTVSLELQILDAAAKEVADPIITFQISNKNLPSQSYLWATSGVNFGLDSVATASFSAWAMHIHSTYFSEVHDEKVSTRIVTHHKVDGKDHIQVIEAFYNGDGKLMVTAAPLT